MLVVRAVVDQPERDIKKGDKFRFYIVDAHHHMGKEKNHRNTPSTAYEYYNLLWFEILKMAKELLEEDQLLFEPVGVTPSSLSSNILTSRTEWDQFNHGWLVDRTVVFPYTDDHSKMGFPESASFSLSNDRIAGWSTRPPHSIRLIGFARVDPLDENVSEHLAVNEIVRAVQLLGLRGLKIHPLAQLFIDEIEDESTIGIVEAACKLQIPVIIDTRSIRTVEKIERLVETLRERLNSEYTRHLKVILAHCGMSPGDRRLYRVLRNPSIYGETSSLHGQDVPVLFQMASKYVKGKGIAWSDKIMFGTDYSFLTIQAADVILHLLSRDFPGGLSDIQRVLGGTALGMIQKPMGYANQSVGEPMLVSCSDPKGAVIEKVREYILSLVHGTQWSLASLDYALPPQGEWPSPEPLSLGGWNGVGFRSCFFTLKSKKTSRVLLLWLRQFIERATSIAVLPMGHETTPSSLEESSLTRDSILMSVLSRNSVVTSSADDLIEMVTSELA